jgi:hypothetical protein
MDYETVNEAVNRMGRDRSPRKIRLAALIRDIRAIRGQKFREGPRISRVSRISARAASFGPGQTRSNLVKPFKPRQTRSGPVKPSQTRSGEANWAQGVTKALEQMNEITIMIMITIKMRRITGKSGLALSRPLTSAVR